MTTRIFLGILISSFFAFTGAERDPFVADYFALPVPGTIQLSGTFGELRTDHFHAGIDIRGGMNVPIQAAAEGFVSRIKVSGAGYGNVLYLEHPKGYTTVYAHLNEFSPEIAEYVEELQYKIKSFSVDVRPDPNLFPVVQGQQIGLMGTTGSSSGPHLHFEIRDTRTGQALNPLRFGLNYHKDASLRIHQLKLYELDDHFQTAYSQEFDPLYVSGNYVLKDDTIYIQSDQVGVALKAYDHMNGGRNWNGIYGLDMFVESQLYFQFRMDAIAFDHSRYINAHLDYEEFVSERSYYNRCYLLPGNKGGIYPELINQGIIQLAVGEKVPVTLKAYNAEGENKSVSFWIKRQPGSRIQPPVQYDYWLEHEQENIISKYNLFLHFPQGTFYRDVPMVYAEIPESSYQIYAPVHTIHHQETPVHQYFTLGLRPSLIPDSLRQKAFVGKCTNGNRIINYGGEWNDGMLVTKTRDFGDYSIFVDTERPTITPRRFQRNMRGWPSMWFTIDDNLSTAGLAKGLTCEATIDGEWALLVYDAKRDRITHEFRPDLAPGEHQLRITLKDAMGNISVFEETFLR